MEKQQVDAIFRRLKQGQWGSIEMHWFEYIDLDKAIFSDYEDAHVLFQMVLQGRELPIPED